jgi:3-hydroxyisobutyryl-CoA hydrolase
LSEINDNIVQRFFSPESPYLANAPALSVPEHLANVTPTPMKYALPSEEEISRIIRASGNEGITFAELLNHFKSQRQGKMGIEEKITEVTQRKCHVVDPGNKLVWIDSRISP